MAAWVWEWDESLYAGSAPHYAVGRMPYPAALAHAVSEELQLDGTGRLLDVGCGPGSLTLLLAPFFQSAVGIDADPDMSAEARRAANSAANGAWAHVFATTDRGLDADDVMKRAGFIGPKVLEVKRGEVIHRRLDEVVSAVFSLSGSAPHLFGDRIDAFEEDLRRLLRLSSPTQWFAERVCDVAVLLWHP